MVLHSESVERSSGSIHVFPSTPILHISFLTFLSYPKLSPHTESEILSDTLAFPEDHKSTLYHWLTTHLFLETLALFFSFRSCIHRIAKFIPLNDSNNFISSQTFNFQNPDTFANFIHSFIWKWISYAKIQVNYLYQQVNT